MICYRDMTFCHYYETCKHADKCPRPLTEEVKIRAEDLGLPICHFMEIPKCWEGVHDQE